MEKVGHSLCARWEQFLGTCVLVMVAHLVPKPLSTHAQSATRRAEIALSRKGCPEHYWTRQFAEACMAGFAWVDMPFRSM